MSVSNKHFLASVCFSEAHDKATIDEVAQLLAGGKGINILEVAPNKGRNRTHVFCASGETFFLPAVDNLLKFLPTRLQLTGQDDGVHGLLQSISFFPFRKADLTSISSAARSIAEKISDQHQLPSYLFAADGDASSPSLPELRRLSRAELYDRMADSGWTPHLGPQVAHQQLGCLLLITRLLPVNLELHFAGDDIGLWEKLLQPESLDSDPDNAMLFQEIDVETDPAFRKWKPVLEQLRTFVDDLPSEKKIRIWCRIGNYAETPLETVIAAFREIGMHFGMPYAGGRIIGHLTAEALTGKSSATAVKALSVTDDHYQDIIRETVHGLSLDIVDNFVIHRQIVDHLTGTD